MDYSWVANRTDDDFAKLDIAEANLRCADGLPGAERLNVGACLERIDNWAARVRAATSKALSNKAHDTQYRELPEPLFRMVCLALMLQNHLGLTYNLAFNEDPYDGSDSRNHFIHAVVAEGYPATCCTAPVIYTAIARRLGYPLWLVKTREHIFCRWEDASRERFNVEATNPGMYSYPDEHYYTWPKPAPVAAVRQGVFLKNLTRREEVALFLGNRGLCLVENLAPAAALEPLFYACRLDPNDPFLRNRWMIATMMQRGSIVEAESGKLVGPDAWRIPGPRKDWERFIYRAACDDLDRIRSNRRKPRTPASIYTSLEHVANIV